ncbi:Translation initiation factor 3 subunit J component [Saitozyma podzolica]|uniref:Eukaryotic translation initiation factor 3 subunit J n=1 Tax=Saitozyma podzolica TaxID=1890683 RepID=A0A427YC58_9TREE|nr:Translation initiation factor 3 subunit J component [Saitozyma podzolica]
MSDDWDLEDEPVTSGTSTPAPVALPKAPARNKKWEGEDEEDEQDDWDASEDEKPKAAAPALAPAPIRKKKLAEKLAEKERLAKLGPADDDLMETRTEQDRRREAREKELEADMASAADLMGSTGVEDAGELLQAIIKARPSTKDDFATYSRNLITALISQHESNPLYPSFVEQFAKDLSESLTAVQVRKVASSLSTLGNTKQQEERDKASGKKKAASKPKLGAVKSISKVDTAAYDDVLDDDDFM